MLRASPSARPSAGPRRGGRPAAQRKRRVDLATLEERADRLNEKLRKVEDAPRGADLNAAVSSKRTSAAPARTVGLPRRTSAPSSAPSSRPRSRRPWRTWSTRSSRTSPAPAPSARPSWTGSMSWATAPRAASRRGSSPSAPTCGPKAIKKGWLNQDLSKILFQQYDQLGAELGIREGVGIGPGRSSRPGSTRSPPSGTTTTDDRHGRRQGDQGPSPLGAGHHRDDIVEARNRLKGNYDDDGTTSGWLKWGSSKLRQANYIRYGGGFLLSSLTDTATVALRHPDFLKYLGPAIREMRAASARRITPSFAR
jgi:hypothetical protein